MKTRAASLLSLIALACAERPVPTAARGPMPASAPQSQSTVPMVELPGGTWKPLFADKNDKDVVVGRFALDQRPTTNAEFAAFVAARPEWRRSQVKKLFADDHYLAHWLSDLDYGRLNPEAPVTNVSWFAARAFAKARGKRLPTLAEWEWAARGPAEDPGRNEQILAWYAQPTPKRLPAVGAGPTDSLGLHDMHGLVWEWVLDFDQAMTSGESRGDASLERSLFCGSGALGSADPRDYAAFMRYAFRSALRADYCVANLGFRCAKDLP